VPVLAYVPGADDAQFTAVLPALRESSQPPSPPPPPPPPLTPSGLLTSLFGRRHRRRA
jgi:hypothetical protein